MLRSFLPLFAMTFLICTFIVLMQFLWQHINDLVGKGLGMCVMAELFFYAALSMVPLALPLAILLASLMTFGNLGESFELTALKAGGISLFRVMKPLIGLVIAIAIGAFFFQNNALPVAQARMWTLLKSMKQKSPELDIVEGEFNYQLPNINIFVREKNRDTGVLYGVMIYDIQQGFERSRVILADSATLTMTPDKTHLYLTMHSGEMFENLRDATGVHTTARNQLYRSEEFDMKQVMVAFDANFNRMDEGDMRSLYIGKNVSELTHSIDSLKARLDSIGADVGRSLADSKMLGVDRYVTHVYPDGSEIVTENPPVVMDRPLDVDSIFYGDGQIEPRRRTFTMAQANIRQKRMENIGRSLYMEDESKILRRHGIELQKKFTLSLACLIFFFIGAPLGAIIRKGGLGMPLVISVMLFIVYYIIDNTGMKMARDGALPVWQGMWLSSAILLPLGIFVTYKAVNDSGVFNADAYKNLWRALLNREKRELAVKEVVIEDMDPQRAAQMLEELRESCAGFIAAYPGRQDYRAYWAGGYPSRTVQEVIARLEHAVSYMANSRSGTLVAALNSVPLLHNYRILHPAPDSAVSKAMCWFVPAGVPAWIVAQVWQRRFRRKLMTVLKLIPEINKILENL